MKINSEKILESVVIYFVIISLLMSIGLFLIVSGAMNYITNTITKKSEIKINKDQVDSVQSYAMKMVLPSTPVICKTQNFRIVAKLVEDDLDNKKAVISINGSSFIPAKVFGYKFDDKTEYTFFIDNSAKENWIDAQDYALRFETNKSKGEDTCYFEIKKYDSLFDYDTKEYGKVMENGVNDFAD